MTSKNFLNLKLASGFLHKNASDDTQLEAAFPNEPKDGQARRPQRPQRRKKKSSYNLLRIPQLLMLGYASEESKRRFVMLAFHLKVDN